MLFLMNSNQRQANTKGSTVDPRVSQFSLALVRQRYAGDGGAERIVARTLQELGAKGVSVTLVARQWHGGSSYETLRCNPFFWGRLWRDWSFARCVCQLLKKRHFSLVQSHERIVCCDIFRAGDGVHREWLNQRNRVLSVLKRLGQTINPYHLYIKSAEKRLFASPRLKAVICISRMVKEEIQKQFSVADDKLHVIYNGVDIETYHPGLRKYRAEICQRHDIPETATLFLFVGSGFERKGVATLLTAMSHLPTDAYLMVVGRDKHQRRYENLAKALDLSKRVRFLGSQQDVKPFYGAADAFVLPTLYDPFPNVTLEAFASGLPVITSYKSGTAELIIDGRNGFVCDALDHSGLAAHMHRMMKADREQMAQAARATVKSMSLDTMSRQLMQLYDAILTK
jgi:UDP-glucose:(heptosyl)LPS alpha-1,3-glucosyltransferase